MKSIIDLALTIKSQRLCFDEHWLQLPSSIKIGNLHGIVQTSDGHIWVQNANEDHSQSSLLQLNANGELISNQRYQELPVPHGLELYQHPQHGECLLHTDCINGLVLMNLDGEVIWHFPKPDFYRLHWTLHYEPSNAVVHPDGKITMFDGYGSYLATTLSPDGKEIHSFGGASLHESGLVPHGCGLYKENNRWVIAVGQCMLSSQDPTLLKKYDQESCIKLYELNGDYIRRVSLDCVSPRHIRSFSDGYLIPDFQERLLVLDAQLNVLASIGKENDKFKNPCDQNINLIRPHDICVLDNNTLLITNYCGGISSLQVIK